MSAAVPNRTPTAYQRLCALPEGMTGEIIGGELHTQPRPSGKHAQAQTGLNVDLGGPFGFGRG